MENKKCETLGRDEVLKFLSELEFKPLPEYEIVCALVPEDLARFSELKSYWQVQDMNGNILAQKATYEEAESFVREKLQETKA